MDDSGADRRGRYVAETPLARFLIEKFGPEPNLSDIERQSTARGMKLLASSLSNYLNGQQGVSTETVRRLALFTDTPEDDIWALLPADPRRGRHKPGLGPTGIEEVIEATVQRVMGEIGRGIVARPETAHADTTPTPTTRLLEVGAVRPVFVDDPEILGEAARAGFGIAWIEPSSAPAPGKIVRVGAAEPPRLKLYEPGDDVTGVAVLLQVSPKRAS